MKKHASRWFTPQLDNNFQPSFLQKTSMLLMGVLVMVSFLTANMQALLWQSSPWLVGAVLPAVVTELTNEERSRYAAQPLVRNAQLDAAATLKAQHMAAEGYFAHYSPGGISPWHWFNQVGYVYAHAGENLAVHFTNSDAVVKAWMKSPTHKANIIDGRYTEIGIGTAKGRYQGYETVFVVQLFGTPAMLPAVVSDQAGELDVIPRETTLVPVPAAPIALAVTEEAILDSVAPVVAGEQDVAASSQVPDVLVQEPASESPDTTFVPLDTYLSPAANSVVELAFMATSSGLVPRESTVGTVAVTSAPMLAKMATQPSTVLQMVFITLGSLVIGVLLVSVFVGWRRRRVVEVGYGVALLGVMAALFYIHATITAGAVIL